MVPATAALLLIFDIVGASKGLGVTQGPIRFEDALAGSGIDFVLRNGAAGERHQIETMMGGVALLDFNGDGRLDVFFANGSRLPSFDKHEPAYWNRLYENLGGLRFRDVTERAGVRGTGYAMAVATGDYDNDGDVDLFVAGVDTNALLHNRGDGTFEDVTAKAGLEGRDARRVKTYTVGAGFFDYDNDGRLDLLLVNYLDWNIGTAPPCTVKGVRAYCRPQIFAGQASMLFHNEGGGVFRDVSKASGIGTQVGKGMAVAFADYDQDGRVDLFVSNDTYRNFLFHNLGDGTFREVGLPAGVAYNELGRNVAGMGVDFRDVDDDGAPDLFETAMYGDTFPFWRNAGDHFEDRTTATGVAGATRSLTAWGAGIFDLDNDGFKDIFTANGAVLDNSDEIDRVPYRLPNLVLRNRGGGNFDNVSAGAGEDFRRPGPHRGAAMGDLNGDGRIDIVVARLNEPPEILVNRSPGAAHWLLVDLRGRVSNRDGLGARLTLRTTEGAAGHVQHNQATTAVGYASASDRRVHFGLGKARVADLEVVWPSGRHQALPAVAADQVLVVMEPEGP